MTRPAVTVIGEFGHADFAIAMERIHADAHVLGDEGSPELIILAQARPGAISESLVQQARRATPLASLVGLLGSWCEGESRTGRPWADVTRLYWHEFPAWWHVQLQLRAAGLCPDWARPGNVGLRAIDRPKWLSPFRDSERASHGVVVLRTPVRDTAEGLAMSFQAAGYTTIWQDLGRPDFNVRGALAGIWDGGQLDNREAEDLAAFCRTLSSDAAPVVALLDFPRRDSYLRALQCGAATVLGKPWRNEELIATIEIVTSKSAAARAA